MVDVISTKIAKSFWKICKLENKAPFHATKISPDAPLDGLKVKESKP
jgi:hypothetical protein